MISILIPVFNQDVTQLAGDLSMQLTALDIGGEILFIDDGSAPAWHEINKVIDRLPLVTYTLNDSNMGRIRIREALAAIARFDWLLFLDGDSALLSESFLQQYFTRLPATPSVIVGGRAYTNTAPTDCSLHLHWRYGSIREAIDVNERNKRPYPGFMSNNFLIHKNLFNKLEFTNDWQGYGHEDTWIGIQLERMQAPVLYIENKVLHDGLETTPVFLAKAGSALHNLNRLQALVPAAVLKKHVRLIDFFYLLKKLRLLWVPGLFNKLLNKWIVKNLHSCHPSLLVFDWYRLALFIQVTKKAISK